MATNLPEKSTY
uniref:Uncharacterized protein n=1 Tax=Arundo donax TaxID=35708 RepID=A0A0A9CJG5_ARUDO